MYLEITLNRALAEVGRCVSTAATWGDRSDHTVKAIRIAKGELDVALRQCMEARRSHKEMLKREKREESAARQKQAEANGWGKK